MRLILRLPALHASQRAVWDEPCRHRVLACGRRWGKTMLGSLACISDACMGGRAWWIAPSYKMAQVGWRGVSHLGQQVPGAVVRQGTQMVVMPGGGSVQVRSADDPQSLRGEGLTLAVLDECSYMLEAAWQEAIRPALSDRNGRAMFISTPSGHDWFWRLWRRGQEPNQHEWRSWQFPTSDNPYIKASEIEKARAELPEQVFRQEYLGEFVANTGLVFRRVTEAATIAEPLPYNPAHMYVMGADWGKSRDFTVLTVGDVTTRQIVCVDRFNQIDYAVQRERLKILADRYQVRSIVAESNSMGEPILEELQRAGLPVVGFATTNATKTVVVEALALALEQGQLSLLQDASLVAELQAYEMVRLPSGLIRYSAPEGLHDDCVISLALCYWGMSGMQVISPETARLFQEANFYA